MSRPRTTMLVAIFIVLASAAMFFWRHNGMHDITGDEPHYLVIADGLLPTFELEQTGPYTREFRNRTIVESGLAPVSAMPDPSNTHGELGPRGLFNVHNIGLPIVLAVPYWLAGEIGARFAMVLISASIVWLMTRFLLLTALTERQKFFVVLPMAVGLPFVSGATQIYPDLPGGAICLSAVYFLFRGPRGNQARDAVTCAVLLAFLPWLHIRFVLPMAILVIAVMLAWKKQVGLVRVVFTFGLPAVFSVILLAFYNWYAFGNITGPYQSGDLMLNRIAIMQFLGLFFDQNQGLAFQQPLYFVAFLYAFWLMKRHPLPACAMIATALSIIVPNATHWNLYGGWSFSGRFGWGAATVLAPLVIFSSAALLSERRRSGAVVMGLALLVQVRHLIAIFVQKRTLFPHTFDGWIGTYSTFWGPIEQFMPQWRDYRWAFSFVPNILFLVLGIGLVLIGATTTSTTKRRGALVGALASPIFVALTLFGAFGELPFPQQRWAASVLPGLTGKIDNLSRVASEGDQKDLLTFGPFWEVPPGEYEVGVRYTSSGSTEVNGILDVYFPDRGIKGPVFDLSPTAGSPREFFFPLEVSTTQSGKIEVRTMYEGAGELRVDWIQLRRVSGNFPE